MAQPIPKTDFEDPVLRALASAPPGVETEEERRIVDEAMARRDLVTSEQLQASIEALREAQEGT